MTCRDCIHLKKNTELCTKYDLEVDIKAYRLCSSFEEIDLDKIREDKIDTAKLVGMYLLMLVATVLSFIYCAGYPL